MKNVFLGFLLLLLSVFFSCSVGRDGGSVSTESPQISGEFDSIKVIGQYGWYSATFPLNPMVSCAFDMKTGEGRIHLFSHPLNWSKKWKTRVEACGDTIKLELYGTPQDEGPWYYDISTKLAGVQAKRYVVSVLLPQEGDFHYSYSFVMDLRDGVEGEYRDVDGTRRFFCMPDVYDCLPWLASRPDSIDLFSKGAKSSCGSLDNIFKGSSNGKYETVR